MRKTAAVRIIKRSTPIEAVPVATITAGTWILANDGTPYEVASVSRPSGSIVALRIGCQRLELPAHASVNRFAV